MKELVKNILVARYYLIVELGKPFKTAESKKLLNDFIYSLSDDEAWNLLRLVSEEYRQNNVYQSLLDSKNKWCKQAVNLRDIKLSDVNSKVKPYLVQTDYNLSNFCNFLKLNNHLEELKEFESRSVRDEEKVFLFSFSDGNYKIIDGNHRIVSLALLGYTEFEGYIKIYE